MADNAKIRLNKVLRELNISLDRAVDFLSSKGHEIDARPTTKISDEVYQVLLDGFQTDMSKKVASKEVGEEKRKEKEAIRIQLEQEQEARRLAREKRNAASERSINTKVELAGPKMVGKIDLNPKKKKAEAASQEKVKETQKEAKVKDESVVPSVEKNVVAKQEVSSKKESAEEEKIASTEDTTKKKEEKAKDSPVAEESKETTQVSEKDGKSDTEESSEGTEIIETQYQKLSGPKIAGDKIDLYKFKKPKKKEERKSDTTDRKKRRKRIVSKNTNTGSRSSGGGTRRGDVRRLVPANKVEPTEEDVQKQVRETLEKLQGKSKKGKGDKYRRSKRDQHREQTEKDLEQQELQSKVLKVTEFVTASEVATMMEVSTTEIISACMSLGIMVTMNQRLDAETLAIVAEEFGYEVDFVTADIEESIVEEEDAPEDLKPRAPIVTVMGHVDHGKTSLLDYIRKENVIAGESGGITQHIGAYGVELEGGQKITFLDTPGHEAFTAMRARGAQVTDLAIIVIAADDDVMPQTIEAINHASAAGVPIVFAINKVDKSTADPEKIKEKLANMNYLVEDWGGKYQSQDISAKQGINVDGLLEKVLLEAEILELKANPDKKANGTVVESWLDQGRGYISNLLVQAGTLKIGDIILAGSHMGRVKAMFNERGKEIKEVGPSQPVQLLGLNGAPQAGDKFNVMDTEKEAKEIATKRGQLEREQAMRTQKHITLDEIGRRIAIGNFKEVNLVVKGDVDGSVEALADAFYKLSTEEIQVNIIHKGVGQITESDILLAAASNAVVIGFQVRPSASARKLAAKEQIDIRLYSVIYDAINDMKDAMEGMLSPDIKEEITGTAEVKETFKIKKVGTIAGCIVKDGKLERNSKVRVIRDGIVIFTGELDTLKRFKDDVKEVKEGYECGLNIRSYNDIKVGDTIEGFKEVEVKKTLE